MLIKSICKNCLETIPCGSGRIRGWDKWDDAYFEGKHHLNQFKKEVACPIFKSEWWRKVEDNPPIECPFFLEHIIGTQKC